MDLSSAIKLAAFVDSIAGSAKQIVSNLFRYFEGVKNAPEKSSELRQEMHALCDLLDSLHLALTGSGSRINQSPVSFQTLLYAVANCEMILSEMSARTASGNDGSGRLGWPFSKAENQHYITIIERHKETFTLALSIKCA
jgi:hypothetical protein